MTTTDISRDNDSIGANACFGFVRIYEKLEHAEDFRRGRLRMRTLGHFKSLRDGTDALRGDPYEAASTILQPSKIDTFKIDGVDKNPRHLLAPVLIHYPAPLTWFAFCLYSLSTVGFAEELSAESLPRLKESMQLSDECTRLGDFAVVVTDGDQFIDRIETRVKALNIGGAMAYVKYYDPNEFHGEVPASEVPFWKPRRFAYQKEFRVVLSPQDASDPYVLDIGDISDISTMVPVSEFNAKFTVGLPPIQAT
jgi:hypothetical protein